MTSYPQPPIGSQQPRFFPQPADAPPAFAAPQPQPAGAVPRMASAPALPHSPSPPSFAPFLPQPAPSVESPLRSASSSPSVAASPPPPFAASPPPFSPAPFQPAPATPSAQPAAFPPPGQFGAARTPSPSPALHTPPPATAPSQIQFAPPAPVSFTPPPAHVAPARFAPSPQFGAPTTTTTASPPTPFAATPTTVGPAPGLQFSPTPTPAPTPTQFGAPTQFAPAAAPAPAPPIHFSAPASSSPVSPPPQHGPAPPTQFGPSHTGVTAPPPSQFGAPPPSHFGAATQVGATTPPPSQFGTAAPPPSQFGAATPPPSQFGAATPSPTQAETATPAPSQATPPPSHFGTATPPPSQFAATPSTPAAPSTPPPSQFGPAPTQSPPPSQFGPISTQSPSPSQFAATPPTQAPPPSQFGAPTSPPSQFGPAPTQAPPPSPFGPIPTQAPPPSQFGPVPAQSPPPSPFGPIPTQSPPPSQFGPAPTQAPPPSQFGPVPTQAPPPSQFGPVPAQSPPPSQFGTATPPPTQFGTPTGAVPPPSQFGAPAAAGASIQFAGAAPAVGQPAPAMAPPPTQFGVTAAPTQFVAAPPPTGFGHAASSSTHSPGIMQPAPAAPSPAPPQQFGAPLSPVASPTTSAGKQIPVKKIDPGSMPTPIPQMTWLGQPQLHLTKHDFAAKQNEPLPPHPLSQFWVVDNGNASIRHVRSTLRAIPTTSALAKQANIPLALVLRPLAPVGPSESAVPEVDARGHDGPMRCRRCKAYANCWDRFIDSGRHYMCSLCDHKNEVPTEKFVPVDATGRPIDPNGRPEYTRGSVSWEVGGAYVMKATGPLTFVLLLDVSAQSHASGALYAFQSAVNSLLDGLHPDSQLRLGIVTFDETIHFYSLNAQQTQPRMLLVSDLTEVFLPMEPADQLIVNAVQSRHVIKALLDALPRMFGSTTTLASCFGAAATAARLLLEKTGGKIVAIQTTMPNHGPGALQPRTKNLNPTTADKVEAQLFQPQIDFYDKLAKTCAENAIGVDLFVLAAHGAAAFDLPSMLPLVTTTGGECHYYVMATQAGQSFPHDLLHTLTRDTAYDCLLRVRTSLGIDVAHYYGSCYAPDGDASPDVVVPVFNSDKTMVVTFNYESGFKSDVPVVFQCALLYTNAVGRRFVTVHTLGLMSTPALAKVFRMADIAAVTLVNNYTTIARPNATDYRATGDLLTDQCVDVLHKYRANCSQSTSPAKQRNLILPESLKLLPVYTMATLRSAMFRHTPNSRAVDERAYYRSLLRRAPIETLLLLLYPRMMALHNLPSTLAIPDEYGYVVSLPPLLPLRAASFEDTGLYLLDNGLELFMYIGKNINSELFHTLFCNTLAHDESQAPILALREPGTSDIANRVHAIVATLSLTSPTRFKPLKICTPSSLTDNHKNLWMIEERLNEIPSYVDYLCNIHRAIQIRTK